MKYYKAVNTNDADDTLFYESKNTLSDKGVLRALVEQGDLDSVEATDYEVSEITEDEYEENSY